MGRVNSGQVSITNDLYVRKDNSSKHGVFVPAAFS